MASKCSELDKQDSDLSSKYTNLLALSNKFVQNYMSRKGCILLQRDLEKYIQAIVRDQPHLTDVPVTVITVLGSDERKLRKLHTDWLIHFFEQGERSPSQKHQAKFGNRTEFEFMKVPFASSSGVYIWPKPYLISKEDERKRKLCWIIHVDGSDVEVLQTVAAVLCSTVILFRESEREALHDAVFKIGSKVSMNSTNFHVYSATHLTLNERNESTIGVKFLEHLSELTVSCLFDTNGQNVPLKNFIKHIETTISHVNVFYESAAHANATEGTCVDIVPTHNAPYTQLENPSLSMPDDKNSQEFKMETNLGTGDKMASTDKNLRPIKFDMTEENAQHPPNNEEAVGLVSCDELQCFNVVKSLRDTLEEHIGTLTPHNVPRMLQCVAHLKSHDYHHIFRELNDMVNAVVLCNNELGNMFDNHVCFSGERDEKQLLRFSESAYRHAYKMIQDKNHVHSELTIRVLHTACVTLQAHYMNQNFLIIIQEKKVADEVISDILAYYGKQLETCLSEDKNVKQIVHFHKILKQHCILMADRCVDSGEKINNVMKEGVERLSKTLDEMVITRVQKSGKFINTTGTRHSNVELTISNFLKKFNKSVLPRIHVFTPKLLKKHHEDIAYAAVVKLTKDETEQVFSVLFTHLVYTLEVQAQKQKNIQIDNDLDNPPLCFYLTSEWMKIGCHLDEGRTLVFRYGGEKYDMPHAVIAVEADSNVLYGIDARVQIKRKPHSLKYHDKILNCIVSAAADFSAYGNIIIQFFRIIKNASENAFKLPLHKMLIIIPWWLNADQRICLRDVVKLAGFAHLTICNETSLIAYSAIQKYSSNTEIIIIFQIGSLGIRTEIFGRLNESSKANICLISVYFQKWVNSQSSSESSRLSYNAFRGTPHAKNPFSSEFPSADCVQTLSLAYNNAILDLHPSVSKSSTSYSVISDQSEFENVFFPFFSKQPNWRKLQSLREHDVYQMALTLSRTGRNISEIIVDHAAHSREPCMADLLQMSDDIISDDTMPDMQEVDKPVSIESDRELIKQKESLLQKCKIMRKQINEGKIRVRALMKKVLLDAIERAENVANDKQSSKQMTDVEELELSELWKEHQFRE